MHFDPSDDVGPTLGLETLARRADAEAASREQLPQGTGIGRYMILHRVGAGGGGMVYAAYDPELHRRVAIQAPPRGGRRRRRQQVGQQRGNLVAGPEADVRAVTPLEGGAGDGPALSSHVVSVYDVGLHGDQVFLAMELVNGGSLREWLKTPRERADILRVLLDAGEGLAAAHAAGLIHRDFKPDNVLVGDDGRVRVADFGLAREGTASMPAGAPLAAISNDARSEVAEGAASATSIGTTATPSHFASRPGLGRLAPPHAGRRRHGNTGVHGSGATRRGADGRAHRSVCVRHHGLRSPHR